jgi:ketosteroid isomerase-like protein
MTPAEILAFADHFVKSIERGDTAAVRACYAPDGKIWHNTDHLEQSVDQNIARVEWLGRTLTNPHYRILRRVALPDGFLQQHVLEGIRADGQRFELDACVIVTMANGVITRLDEYLDSAQTVAAVTAKSAA